MSADKPTITIANRDIGINFPPYVIAELSANHNGDIDRAKSIILAAKKAGADAVKLQTYRPDTITLKSTRDEFKVKNGLWKGKTLYELYEWAHTPWEWHRPLFDYARSLELTIFSSPFDNSAVDLLEDLNAPAYKIASCELIDLPLINYVASTGKPMIISTGMGSVEEISAAIDAARDGGCKELAILRCVSGYPAPAEEYNLRTLTDMLQRYGLVTGLSDHTIDNTTAITSIALGSSIIEKHFTLDRNAGGPDDSFSLEPQDLKQLCTESKKAWSALGKVTYEVTQSEQPTLKFRRSLYYAKDVAKGNYIQEADLISVRPANGLSPADRHLLVGKKAKYDISKHTPTKIKDVEGL